MNWQETYRRKSLRELARLEREIKKADVLFRVRCSASRHEIHLKRGQLLLLSHRAGLLDKSGDVRGGSEAEDILSLLGGKEGAADENDRCRCKEIRFWWEAYTSLTAGKNEEMLYVSKYGDEQPWLRQVMKSGRLTPSEILAKIPVAVREFANKGRRIADLRNDYHLEFSTGGPIAGNPWFPGATGEHLYEAHQKALPKYQKQGKRRGSLQASASQRYDSKFRRRDAIEKIYTEKAARILQVPLDQRKTFYFGPADRQVIQRTQNEPWWKIAAERAHFIACQFPPQSQWFDSGFPPAAMGWGKRGHRGVPPVNNMWVTFYRDEDGNIQVVTMGADALQEDK